MRDLRSPSAWLATFLVGCVWIAVPAPAAGDIYQFVDEAGTVHLSNVPTDPRYKLVLSEGPRTPARKAPKTLERLIASHARRHGVHPALLRAVIKAESNFDPMAVSRAGAIGLMQLMPETALMLGVRNPFDPDQNIRAGAQHLRTLLDRFNGSLALALAAYNAGAAAVERYQALPPYPETKHYVKKVLNHYRRYLVSSRAASTLTPVLAATR